MMEKSLNYEINTYFQNGKPSAVKPVMIEYRTNSGKGTINFDMVRFFPASVHDVKAVIDILWMAPDTYEKAEIIAEYLRNVISDLQSLRSADAYSYTEKQYNTKLTGFIKKYLANLEKIAGAFGLETVKDEKAECAKMHKCEVHTIHFEDGKKVIKTFDGKYFVKNGVKFKVYKAFSGRYEIIVAGTGISIGYCNKLEIAPEFIDEEKERAIANIKKNNGFEAVHADFVALCDAQGITAPELSPVLLNNQEPETTPALDAKSETSEARPAADQETRTAEKPARKEEKPARNVIKRDTNRISGVWKQETTAGAPGDRFEVYKIDGSWIAINTHTLETYNVFPGLLRNAEFFEIETQHTGKQYDYKTGYKLIDRYIEAEKARRDQVPQKTRTAPQVWKPCIMSTLRKNGIIYRDIIGATDRQEPASADRLKAVLRLPKMQWCINLGATDKKPVTGEIQAHKGKPVPGGYPTNKDGRNTAATPQARKMPQVTVRGSPQNQGEKNLENLFYRVRFYSKIGQELTGF